MKQFFVYLSVVIVVIFVVACSNKDEILESPNALDSGYVYLLTVDATKGDNSELTRALELSADSKISASWSTTEDVFVMAPDGWFDGSLKPQSNGSSTKLKGTISGQTVNVGDKISLLFPRKDWDYTGQIGTLEDIASKYDYSNALNVSVTEVNDGKILTESATFGNPQTIIKFTLVDIDGSPIKATKLTIKAVNTSDQPGLALTRKFGSVLATGDIEITPSGSTNEIYAALSKNGTAISRLTLIASYGGEDYIYTKEGFNFTHRRYYDITVQMPKYPIDLSSVTKHYVGSVIGSDGKVYFDMESAYAAGTTASAIIAYVGSDTGDENFKKGLAISMRDVKGSPVWKSEATVQDNVNMYNTIEAALSAKESGRSMSSEKHTSDYPAINSAYLNDITADAKIGEKPSSITSDWFLPSIFQWNQIVNGLTGKSADLSESANDNCKADLFNGRIVLAGGMELFPSSSPQGRYWSSSECSTTNIWTYNVREGSAEKSVKSSAWPKTRAVFAF